MRNNHLFNYRSIAVIVALLGVFALLVVAAPAQASPALQLTPGPTVVVPTVVIPDTGGDTTTVVTTPLFSNWIFWAALGLILLVVVIALLARPTTTTHTHYHDDDHI